MISTAPLVFGDDSYWLHIKETGTWFRDLYRSAFWNILKLLAEIINCIQDAVSEILKWNIYTKLTELDSSFSYNNIKGVALIIVVVAITFVGILLIVNGDKMHIKDSVKNILIALCLIIGMPALLGSLDDFMFGKNGNNGYASQTSITADNPTKEGTIIKLGDNILAMQLYDNIASVSNNKNKPLAERKQYTYADSNSYKNNGSPRDIDINALASQSEIDRKYVSSVSQKTQKKYSDLTMNNCVDLLGMTREYETLIKQREIKWSEREIQDDSSNTKTVKEIEQRRFYYVFKDGAHSPNQNGWTVDEFELEMIKQLSVKAYNVNGKTLKVSEAKNISSLKNAQTFEAAVDAIKEEIVWQLNYIDNVQKSTDDNITVNTKMLRTLEDYKKMGWIEQAVTVDIWEPNDDERVYAYDYDFFPAFVDMLIVIICLIFALLKLCRMLWEIAFMHIFVPLVIATDAHGSGRAKRAVQHLITTFAILIVVLISLKLYISLINEIHGIKNLIARWGLILAGAHFVIDGSDFIVKMTGMDAGVKSGAATLLGLRSAAGMAKGVGNTTVSVVKTGATAANHIGGVAGGAANHIGGAAVGTVVGAISGMVGGTSSGAEGHDSIAGQATGAVTGAVTGGAAGAVRGGAEGARRGITGLFRRNENSDGTSSGRSTGGSTDGGSSSASSGASSSSSQDTSSDTGTAATPPPVSNGNASSGGDAGTVADLDTSESRAETAAPPNISSSDISDDSSYDASSDDVQREGTIFTRAYNAGSAVGSTTGHPINTAVKMGNKVKDAKTKYDLSKQDGFQNERTTAKEIVKNRVDDFIKGKYKDNNGNGGNC